MTYRIITRILFSLFCLFCLSGLHAQGIAPYWILKPPVSESDYYYYRVTSAEGKTYNDAYAKAFSMAILESQWKLGVKVQKSDDLDSLENNIIRSINVESVNMKLPLNKVCEYSEPLNTSNGIRLFILWQVARYGNVEPRFEDFNKCY